MFENSVVESRPRRRSGRRAITLPISLAFHFIAISGAIAGSIWQTGFPAVPPNQLSLIRVDPAPPPLQQSPPVQRRSAASEPKPETVLPATHRGITVPVTIPDTIVEPSGSGGEDVLLGGGEVGESAGEEAGDGVANGGDPGGFEWAGEQGPFPVGGDVRPPVVIERHEPRYPAPAIKAGLRGTVVVECIIGRDGALHRIEIARGVHPLLDKAAIDAVRGWRFRPGTLNGRPVDTIFRLSVTFELQRR